MAGPLRPTASPMITKMPVPMMAPRPSAVRLTAPTALRRPPPSPVSASSCSAGLRAQGPRAVAGPPPTVPSPPPRHPRPPAAVAMTALARRLGRGNPALGGDLPAGYPELMPPFRLDAAYSPMADQPKAIDGIVEALGAGVPMTTLLGATGTGKTMTMASVIERVQRPTLVMAHNKTLAAQLCNEFRSYFPDNAVEYFVSYYDYYQPEAYVPSKDLYIEKDSAINEEIDRLRHAATAALFGRRDVIIVASVSAIF